MKNSKIISDYLGYKYIPFNDLQGFPKAGVWEEIYFKMEFPYKMKVQRGFICKNRIEHKTPNGIKYVENKGTEFIRFKARTYKDLTLSIEELLKVVEKLENEDLRRYGYKWTFGDEQYFNNLGLDFNIWDRVLGFDMNFELDPSKSISRKEFKNYGEDFRDKLEELIIETIEYVNRIKNR